MFKIHEKMRFHCVMKYEEAIYVLLITSIGFEANKIIICTGDAVPLCYE
jgi:hypothetical protein